MKFFEPVAQHRRKLLVKNWEGEGVRGRRKRKRRKLLQEAGNRRLGDSVKYSLARVNEQGWTLMRVGGGDSAPVALRFADLKSARFSSALVYFPPLMHAICSRANVIFPVQTNFYGRNGTQLDEVVCLPVRLVANTIYWFMLCPRVFDEPTVTWFNRVTTARKLFCNAR